MIENTEALDELAKLLCGRAATIADIMIRLKCSQRTAYRWIEALRRKGLTIVQWKATGRPPSFSALAGGRAACPRSFAEPQAKKDQ